MPTGLSPGETYHLAFVTSGLATSTSPDIEWYDNFVQSAANTAGIGVGSSIGDIEWSVIGSTSTVNARDHVSVSGPVYLLDGITKIADNSADLWDGTLDSDSGISLDENGAFQSWIAFTGSLSNGMKNPFTNRVLGFNSSSYGLVGDSGPYWLHRSGYGGYAGWTGHFYGISEQLTASAPSEPIPEPSTLVLFGIGMLGILGVIINRKRRFSN